MGDDGAPAGGESVPFGDLIAEGYRRLEEGDPSGAIEAFCRVAEADPTHLAAREGLAWAWLRAGDPERAAALADERLALKPEDPRWQTERLVILGLAPSRRGEAIAGYRARCEPTDALLPCMRLAELLSRLPADRAEAAAVYHEVLAHHPDSREATLGLAELESWEGRLEEANARFEAVLAAEPSNPRALLGRARSARWAGDWDAARGFYARLLEVVPEDAEARLERVQMELDPALIRASERATEEEARLEAARRAREPRLGLHPTVSLDSADFLRLALPLLRAQVYLSERTRLRAEATETLFSDPSDSVWRTSLGVAVRQGLWSSGLFADVGYRVHLQSEPTVTHEGSAELGFEPPALPLAVRAGVRQRSIVEQPPGYEEIAYLAGIGSGGMTVAGMRAGYVLREAYGAASWSPTAGGYVYAQGELGRVGQGNRRRSAGAGAGFDLLHALDNPGGHLLRLKVDFYYLDYDEPRTTYFAPDDFQVYTPSLEWQLAPGSAWLVGAEAGSPIRFGESVGVLAGAFFRFAPTNTLELLGRVRYTDDTEFRILGATLGATFVFE